MKTTIGKKECEEISVEIVRVMAEIDHIHQRLTDATDPGNITARRMLTNHRGLALSELAFFEGYLAALCDPLPLAIIQRGTLSKTRLAKP